MSRKHTLNFIYNYSKQYNYICLSKEYLNSHEYLEFQCPNNHIFKMKWAYFKYGQRCPECYGNKKYKYQSVKKYIESFEGYKLLSNDYKNNKTILKIKCPNNHTFNTNFNNFKSKNSRCRECKYINQSKLFTGENNPSWNHNREEISLNQRLRKTITKSWIIKNLKNDPNYNNYLLNSNEYQIDHIIPIKAFCENFYMFNGDENLTKTIANDKINLQLIKFNENQKKKDKYNKKEFINYINIFGINERRIK